MVIFPLAPDQTIAQMQPELQVSNTQRSVHFDTHFHIQIEPVICGPLTIIARNDNLKDQVQAMCTVLCI